MRVYMETTVEQFNFWAGARNTYKTIREAGKLAELEALIDEWYPDGIEDTRLNDILWFDSEWLFEELGIEQDEDE